MGCVTGLVGVDRPAEGEHRERDDNFDTRPDGIPGRMQMYLFEPIPLDHGSAVPFADVNGTDDAEIVWHEYTHGLFTRLITDVQGFGALLGTQSAAMGEA